MIATFSQLGHYGRFGNQCFQIASTIGIARNPKNGYDFAFPKWINWDHKERFQTNEPIDVFNYFVNPLPELNGITDFKEVFIHWGYWDVILNGNSNLVGHMQSERYFKHCMDEVRHYFRMKDEPEQNDCIAIHYRGGDYIEDENAYHPRCTKEYYESAMSLFPDGPFVVFTDDLDSWKEFRFGRYMTYYPTDYLYDFKIMKRCKHFICANSSYSLFAAILGEHPEKKIVCPKKWFGDVAGLDTSDIYPENAIII